ncbi:s-phase kinase-associated [Cyclospora cayetanensis]|uniref:S-phase kinase-associated n=1 Tax=Cyclospora cayetanensis TaxID=88456 RepID=A0A1D3CXQ6_9EIME|nr:s-phase kinase-associated [Cyclospora cayetanensis]
MEAEGRYVVLVSSEGEEIKVPREVASASLLVKSMTEDGDDSDVVPLPKVSSAILRKVVEYCTHHHDNPPEDIPTPLKTSNLAEVVSEFDFNFVNVEQTVLFDLLLAADYLNIPSLLLLTSAKVASMIKGRSPEEIRREFNIVNDFTPEEEAQYFAISSSSGGSDDGMILGRRGAVSRQQEHTVVAGTI